MSIQHLYEVSNPLRPMRTGICRYCRCTDAMACDEGCSWVDKEHTVCSSDDCVRRFLAAVVRVCEGLGRLAGARRERSKR